jgi:hypothetical protein
VFDQLIELYARQYVIPLEIAKRLINAESAGKPQAVSPKGAMGLAQLMPGTAKDMGVTDPYDPEQSVRGGMQYLKKQYDRFGSWPLALAAYNAGPERVARAGGIPGISETQNYVAKITSGLPEFGGLPAVGGQIAALQMPSRVPANIAQPAQGAQPTMDLQQLMAQLGGWQQESGPFDKFLNSPLTQLAAGVMSAPRDASTGQKLGYGLLGLSGYQQQQQQQRMQQMQMQMLLQKYQQEMTQQQMAQAIMQRMMGAGGAGGGMSGREAAQFGALGGLVGMPGAAALTTYGTGMMPYEGMTQAQQAEAQDRQMRRQMEMQKLIDEGVVPGESGAAQPPPEMPGAATPRMSPRSQREIMQKGREQLLGMDTERLKGMREQASAASRLLPNLDRMLRLNATAPSGRLAPAQMWAGQMAESVDSWLGTSFKDWVGSDGQIADAEQFFASAADVVRDKIKALGSGAAISNVDLLFTRESVPSLTQTKEGRQKIIEAMAADARNLRNMAQQAEEHFRANPSRGLEGFEPKNLERPGWLKQLYVVGPNGEKFKMQSKEAAKFFMERMPGFQLVEED